MKVKDAIKRLQCLKPNETIAMVVWHVEDVKEVAKASKVRISKNTCEKVLEELEIDHDANIGINWDVIRTAIENYSGE